MASRVALTWSSSTRFCSPWPQHERYLEATCECSLRGGGPAATKMPRRKLQKFPVAGHHVRCQSRRKSIPRTKPLQQSQAVRKRALCRCRQIRIPVRLLRLAEGCLCLLRLISTAGCRSSLQWTIRILKIPKFLAGFPLRTPHIRDCRSSLRWVVSFRHPTGP